jgi:hypothetical protein
MRVAVFFSAATLAGAFGGLLAYAKHIRLPQGLNILHPTATGLNAWRGESHIYIG